MRITYKSHILEKKTMFYSIYPKIKQRLEKQQKQVGKVIDQTQLAYNQ